MFDNEALYLLGGIVTLVLGYILSGQIRRTDADRLWLENAALRKECQARVRELEAERDADGEEIERLKHRIAELERQVWQFEFQERMRGGA